MCMSRPSAPPPPPPPPEPQVAVEDRRKEEAKAATEQRAREARAKGRQSLLTPETNYLGVPEEPELNADSRALLIGR
jgi:hypothetical protein